MKKLLMVLVLIMTSVSMFSQITSNGKPETLKSFRMGVCKLIKTGEEITIKAKTREASGLDLIVRLGDTGQAVAIIQSMIDYTPSKGEVVSLNNPSDNTAEYEKFSGTWAIRSRGDVATIAVGKGELKKMLAALK